MFDARSLLEQLMRGGGQTPAPQQAPGGGGLADILGQLGKALGQGGGQSGQAPQQAPGGGGLDDLLGQLGKAMGQGQNRQVAQQAPQGGSGGGLDDLLGQLGKALGQGQGGGGQPMQREQAPSGGQGGGGLGDILGRIGEQMGRGGQGGGQQQGGGGGLMDILGQVLGQAKDGVREGAGRIDQATGASERVREATGKSPDDLLAQLKELIENNKVGAGAVAGGLGSILLGTRTGRAIAGKALRIGGLALIGGLAYKALQNYQQGRPLIAGAPGGDATIGEAPRGSGFEASAVSNEAALLYIRGMVAAAAADGRIDAGEQQKILGSLKQAGLDAAAEEFLANELNTPASVADLARSVSSEAEAIQLFTASRIAIDLDTAEEHEFLVSLAQTLGLDGNLVAHIDAEARAAA